MTKTTIALLAGVSATALLAFPASAQTAPAAPQEEVSTVDDIVVTARRRDESLLETPVPISAIASEELQDAAIGDIIALSGAVPNVSVQAVIGTTNGAQVFLRGVGNDDPGFNFENSIGVYMDDVYVGRQVGTLLGVLDLERIEVLRGPQGTLYGRNSTGGAVKYVTRKPDLQSPNFNAGVTLGSFNRTDVNLTGSVPLIPDVLAVQVSASSRDSEGWFKIVDTANVDTGRRANGINTQDARIALRWAASPSVTVDLTADISRNKSGPQGETSLLCAPGTNTGNTRCPFTYGAFNRGNYFYPDNTNKFEASGFSGVVTWDTPLGTVKSVTAYRSFDDRWGGDLSGNNNRPLAILQTLDQSQFQQELQLQSDLDGRLNYIAGLFYFEEDLDNDAVFTLAAGGIGRRNIDVQSGQSFAVFGEVYFDLTEALELTLGGRYSMDDKSIDRQFFPTPTAAVPTGLYSGSTDSDTFTPKVGLSYTLGDALIYATYSQGYRPGGWVSARPTAAIQQAAIYAVETETNYEVGFKSPLFDRRLTFDGSVFRADYENLQASTSLPGGGFAVVTADARYTGAEIDLNWRPIEGLRLGATLGLLDAEYTSPPVLLPTARSPKQAPEYTGRLSVDYAFAPGDLPGEVFIGGEVSQQGDAFRSVANDLAFQTDPYTLVDARIGYRSADDRWTLVAGGTNLTDEEYFLAGVSNYSYHYQKPREFYLSLRARF